MSVFRNFVFVAALVGLLAAVVTTALQMLSTVPLIHQAEVYEQVAGVPQHDRATAADALVHEHEAKAWEPAEGFERYSFTALANLLTGIGFAILVVTSEFAGGTRGQARSEGTPLLRNPREDA